MTFDSFGWTAVAILQALTFDGWTEPMFALVDATDVASSTLAICFFLFVVIIGGFFVVNLFLAVLFEAYVQAETLEKEAIAERARQLALKEERKSFKGSSSAHADGDNAPLLKGSPSRCECAPSIGSWRSDLDSVVNSTWFNHGSTGLVLINLVLMCMPYHGMSEEHAQMLAVSGQCSPLVHGVM